MSIENPGLGELFTLRIYKETDTSPFQVWDNNYELRCESAEATLESLKVACGYIVAFEKAITQDTARFNRYVVSTYQEDGVPYDPASFTSVPLTGLGAVASPPDAETLPLNVCLFLRREVPTGRYGKLFIRRALDETQVSGRNGVWRIDPAALAEISTNIAEQLETAGVSDMIGPGAASGFALVMAAGSGVGATFRYISDFNVGGVRDVKFNNRYFDRA